MDSNFIKAVSAYNTAASITPMKAGQDENDNPAGGMSDFSNLVASFVKQTQNTIATGETMSGKALTKDANLANVVTAVSEAEIALQSIVGLRDKMLSAYQDIIKMTI